MTDEELLERARAGDPQALAELISRHEAMLGARVRRLLPERMRRRVAVSDVIQETRITAYARIGGFVPEGEASFRSWLLAIAERKARRAVQWHRDVGMRSLQREVTQAERLPTGQFPGAQPTPSELAVADETAELARQALASLSEDDRTVLRLCRDEGLSFAEAAVRMDRSYEAVKKLYGRALARFAARLTQLGGGRP